MRYALRVGVCAAAMLAAPFAAGAADLPVVPPAAATPLWSWTGVYAGGHLASGWAGDTWRSGTGLFAPFLGDGAGSGPLGGGQLGVNYRTGPWVLGLEAAGSFAGLSAETACARALFNCTIGIDGIGTFTGRFGFAFDQFLIYGKGGAAIEHAHYQLAPTTGNGVTSVFNGSATTWGWTAGVGVEFAFNPALSAFTEYDFLDFGSRATTLTDQNGLATSVVASQAVHLVKVGLNYKFGQAPWAAATGAPPLTWTAPPAAWSWTGFYAGLNAGGGFGPTNWNSATGLLGIVSGSTFAGAGNNNGFLLGGQLGYNYQIGSWVIGAEADAGWSDLDGNAKCGASETARESFTCHTHINALGTFAGRAGLTFGNLLIFGKAGTAWANETRQAVEGIPTPTVAFTVNDTRWGWTLGAGFEYAFTPAWSGKVEYDYLNFADRTFAFAGSGFASGFVSNVGVSQSLNVVKLGMNYKFGSDPTAIAPAAGPMWVKAPVVLKAPPLAPGWIIEAGARDWVSSGRKQQDLYDNGVPTQINSRLTYEAVTGQAAEAFARLDHRDGMFLKGNFGLGDLAGGRFYDEDFPPGIVPYSNTLSSQRDGRVQYGSLDAGHLVLSGPGGDLGGYVGYRYFYERENAFGFIQLAHPEPTTPTSLLGITETETYSGLAVGVNARLNLAERWRLELDAALLPDVRMWGTDNHWFRADINPGPERGFGWGTQFEAILTYALTDQWTVGAGARYWYFVAPNSIAQFPGSATNSPILFSSERYGGFLQASYKFGAPATPAAAVYKPTQAPVVWTGIYTGGSFGAGFGRTNWSDPFGPTSIGDQDPVAGALAGGQVGANYQFGVLVYGLEAAGSWAQLSGTATCFAGNPNQGIAGQNCGSTLGALAAFTGRVGYAAARTLYYVKAGPAFGHSTFRLNFGGAEPGVSTFTSNDRWGWTIGAGIEQALTEKWSIVGEYKYIDLGSSTVRFAGVPDDIAEVASERINQRYQAVTLGLNYKLN